MDYKLWNRFNSRFILMHCIFTVVCLQSTHGLDLSQCRKTLGMQSGDIPDAAITASSSFNKYVRAENARLRTEYEGGAWCPKGFIDQDSYEFLQIDLWKLTVITMVGIQGRFNNGQGELFADEFFLEYQRDDGGKWIRFKNRLGQERFDGNSNTWDVKLRDVTPVIIGKKVRFIPYSRTPRHVCMRVEIYGCKWTDGVVSYAMSQGDKKAANVYLSDFTYDGTISVDNYLHDGLGQLTDGEKGQSNFKLDSHDLGKKGYEWVGWKNNKGSSGTVTIDFKFDKVRNFSAVYLHCNNFFSKGVRLFRQAVIYYSIGGVYFTQMKDKYMPIRDSYLEYSRDLIIRLDHFQARYVKLELYFDANWILISEIQFTSDENPDEGQQKEDIQHSTQQPGGSKTTRGPRQTPQQTGGQSPSSGIPDETTNGTQSETQTPSKDDNEDILVPRKEEDQTTPVPVLNPKHPGDKTPDVEKDETEQIPTACKVTNTFSACITETTMTGSCEMTTELPNGCSISVAQQNEDVYEVLITPPGQESASRILKHNNGSTFESESCGTVILEKRDEVKIKTPICGMCLEYYVKSFLLPPAQPGKPAEPGLCPAV